VWLSDQGLLDPEDLHFGGPPLQDGAAANEDFALGDSSLDASRGAPGISPDISGARL
jgi:hypothetical protein